MTELYYVGTEAECNVVRDAMNVVMDYPTPPLGSGLSAAQKAAAIAAWNTLSPEQRTDANMAALLPGWTVQYSMLYAEWEPGTRRACIVPSDLDALMSLASAAGRTLTLEQTSALLAARAVATTSLPANWLTEPDPT
jgi:hypothetical protein